MLENLKQGDIIKYKSNQESEETYLIMRETKWGIIYGQMVIPVGVNSISIEELVKKEFSLGKFSQ